MIRRMGILITATLLFTLGACGGDDDGGNDPDPAADDAAADDADGSSDDTSTDTNDATNDGTNGSAADDAGSDAAEENAVEGGGNGTATLQLDNGESFEFSILCNLAPQMAAGSEILFTAVSYDTPGLDVTQFGDEGTVTGIATIGVFDESYETLWEASSMYDAFGGTIDLSLDGSTIRGSGSFFPEADFAATPVEGELIAEC